MAEPTNLEQKVADVSLEDTKKSKPSSHLYPQDEKHQFIDSRIELFEALKKEHDEWVAQQPREPIKITLKDGSVKEGTSWETSPIDIAKDISKSLVERTVISKVNGELWDLERPLEKSSDLELLDFDTDEGKQVFWHSSAHVLGEAAECHYGAHLCIGPPIEDGFYYEMSIDNGHTAVAANDFPALEAVAKKAIKDKQKFERLSLSKENLLKMFAYNKYKQYIISDKIPDGTYTTVYRCGPLIDLCRGPHVPHTGRIKAMKLLKNSASYFLGDANNDSLQRIYGVSFPDKKLMDAHLKFLEEAAKRDHRKIGKDQELFMFNDYSPGSCFWLPHGARLYNALLDLLKKEYYKRGYEEVITPNMYDSRLWKTSGHWGNYKDNMFTFDVEKETFGLKPMNCPGHCLMFGARERSYRELPWRVADFGVLHRNEASGALSGLTRVRRFQQDDAHIFCSVSQIGQEIEGIFDFLNHVYGILGFDFKMELSTRPDKYLGDIKTWDEAESKLKSCLNDSGHPWELNPGDGAFYGPKIDVKVADALRRWHQCATIQLDFQLPNQFQLQYRAHDSVDDATGEHKYYETPVMIHRAIYGSLERFIAILTEHFFGKWPLWLSPRQVLIVPIGPKYYDYAQKVRDYFHSNGFYTDVDLGPNTLQKKVRSGQLQQYNYLFIVGEEEETSNSVNVRKRDDPSKQGKTETVKLEDALERLKNLSENKKLHDDMF